MCLLFVAWRRHPGFPLVVAANRDEFHARPASPAAFWEDAPEVLAGRDLEASGTWMGVTRGGRFAALTNYREALPRDPALRSRGLLVGGFLTGSARACDYCEQALDARDRYAGFNLFACDDVRGGGHLVWCSNRAVCSRDLSPGVYGLSNHLLDTPWPKVVQGKRRFVQALAAESEADALEKRLFELLADRYVPPDDALPDTGVGRERERALAAAFIRGDAYGTRAASVLLAAADGTLRFVERSFDAGGVETGTVRHVLAGAGDDRAT